MTSPLPTATSSATPQATNGPPPPPRSQTSYKVPTRNTTTRRQRHTGVGGGERGAREPAQRAARTTLLAKPTSLSPPASQSLHAFLIGWSRYYSLVRARGTPLSRSLRRADAPTACLGWGRVDRRSAKGDRYQMTLGRRKTGWGPAGC